MTKRIELLAPARNKEQGVAAIDHGADAVYIGAPLFGARAAAGNKLADIEELVKYAHIYGSKVFATVNTLLFDDELAEAEQLIWQLYDAGVDALIVQDMGILEMNLPPIELHASTQTHNIDIRRIKFLEQVGFKRIILARETSLEQMAEIRKETTADLEAFVQGALCVCYSGQCYMSQFLTGRSGNRGCCTQPCRSAYDLINEEGKTLRHNEHLLSLKDFSAAQHIESMISAGIKSFKIEGRLKDLSYVKNVTAYYRRLLDDIIEGESGLRASSSGKTILFFEPDLERTFNRGFTDYFLKKRQPMASYATQKSMGKKIGKAVSCKGRQMIVNSSEPLVPGDGICYFNDKKQLEGFLINHVEGRNITANKNISLKPGTELWRNNDFSFEKKMAANTSERKISVSMTLAETATGIELVLNDEDGCEIHVTIDCDKEKATNEVQANEVITRQLSKLGGSPFKMEKLDIEFSQPLFIRASLLNELRRSAVDKLTTKRLSYFHVKDNPMVPNNIPYYQQELDGRANVTNSKAEEFYRRHGVTLIERGPDEPQSTLLYSDKNFPLMTTKYCLRYELGQCLMHKNNSGVAPDYAGELFLQNNGRKFKLFFDCKACEMKIFE